MEIKRKNEKGGKRGEETGRDIRGEMETSERERGREQKREKREREKCYGNEFPRFEQFSKADTRN